MRRLNSVLTACLITVLIGGFSGCGYFQAPKGSIDVTPLHVGVKSDDTELWQDCIVSLNTTAAGDMGIYRYKMGNVKPASENFIFLSQFSLRDGKRFIPILNKVTDVTLKCKYPSQPLHYEPS